MFPLRFRSEGYHPKEQVLGLVLDGEAKAYPFVELAKKTDEIKDELGGQSIQVRYNSIHQSAEVFDANGHALPGITLFWFAWYVLNPKFSIKKNS